MVDKLVTDLHGPPPKCDYNCNLSISRNYRELRLTGFLANKDSPWAFGFPLGGGPVIRSVLYIQYFFHLSSTTKLGMRG